MAFNDAYDWKLHPDKQQCCSNRINLHAYIVKYHPVCDFIEIKFLTWINKWLKKDICSVITIHHKSINLGHKWLDDVLFPTSMFGPKILGLQQLHV